MIIRIILIMISLVLLMFSGGCEHKEDEYSELPDISVVDISENSNWDYWVVGKEDYYYVTESNSKPVVVLFHSTNDNKDYSITFNDNSLPEQVVVNDYIYLFDNYNNYKVDIGVIYPNGEIEIFREVETNYNWNMPSGFAKVTAWSDVIRWTGRVVSGIPCALSVAATISTSGAGWPLAAWVCGNYILGLSADIASNEFDVHNGFTSFVDEYGMAQTAISCSSADYLACAISASNLAFNNWEDHQEHIENMRDEVQTTSGALESGYGDVQVTLTWNTTADLDLWVTDPYGEKIYYLNKTSSSGGWLDVDDVDGYGPENVYWPTDQAPSGTYIVQLDHYSGASPSNYTVLVQAFNQVETYTGTIYSDQTRDIVTFSSNGNLPIVGNNLVRYLEDDTKKQN